MCRKLLHKSLNIIRINCIQLKFKYSKNKCVFSKNDKQSETCYFFGGNLITSQNSGAEGGGEGTACPSPYKCHCTIISSSSFLPRCMQCRRGLAMRILSVCPSVRPSVRLSVCLSVTRVHCDKTVERSVQIYIPYERTLILVFWGEEWLVGGDPFYVKFWVNQPPLERNRRFSTNNRS